MDDNPIKDAEENAMFEVGPESTPPGAASFSIKAQKEKFLGGGGKEQKPKTPSAQRLSKESDPALQQRVNAFLNETSKGSQVDDRKFQSRLSREDYYCYSVQDGDVVQGALDGTLSDKGVMILGRIRTNPDASRRYFDENGNTLGQAIFEDATRDFKEKGAKGISAEVTADGHKFLKRMAEQGLLTVTRDESTGGADRLVEGTLTA
ncbi:MAG: hypothetical protein AAB531_02325 [Patescibacteria group bacterium]